MKEKDIIKSKEPMNIWISYDKDKFESPHLVRADKIVYIHDKDSNYFDHHLMFYLNKVLVFKVWLKSAPKDNPYPDINSALKDVGIKIT